MDGEGGGLKDGVVLSGRLVDLRQFNRYSRRDPEKHEARRSFQSLEQWRKGDSENSKRSPGRRQGRVRGSAEESWLETGRVCWVLREQVQYGKERRSGVRPNLG